MSHQVGVLGPVDHSQTWAPVSEHYTDLRIIRVKSRLVGTGRGQCPVSVLSARWQYFLWSENLHSFLLNTLSILYIGGRPSTISVSKVFFRRQFHITQNYKIDHYPLFYIRRSSGDEIVQFVNSWARTNGNPSPKKRSIQSSTQKTQLFWIRIFWICKNTNIPDESVINRNDHNKDSSDIINNIYE